MTTQDRPLPSSLLSSIALITALLIGIGLGIAAYGPNVFQLDIDVTTAIQRMDGPVIEFAATIGNTLGSTLWAAIIIGIALTVAAIVRAWPDLIFLTSLLVLRLLGTMIKPIFDSPRPTEELVTISGTFDGTGYPSGHALTAATMALGLAIIAWRQIPSRRVAIAVNAALILLAAVIGWARIWTGAHWMTDVIGGYALGIAFVAASLQLLHRIDTAGFHGSGPVSPSQQSCA